MEDPKFMLSFNDYMVIKSLGLPSDNFYEKLDHDKDINLSNYNSECISFSRNKINWGLKRPCALVLKYLANSKTESEKVNWDYDDCILLNYWIYGKIYEQHRDISKSAHPFAELQSLWNSLLSDPSKKQYHNKCKPDNLIAIQEDWEKRKVLYDYFVDYDMLQSMIPYYDKPCEEIYMYLKEKDALYKEYSEKCSRKGNYMCPDFFSKCKKKDPNILLRQLKCYKQDPIEDTLTVKDDKRSENSEIVPRISTDKSGLPLNSQKAPDGTNPVTNSGNVLLGVVVTSMTSGALYKFTPLGRMLRNGLGFNRNNINIHDNGLFDYSPGSFNPYSMGGDEHYIGYQPA